MDAFLFFSNLQTEKALAMRIYTLYTSIAHTFRVLQLCTSLLLLYWILTCLSSAVQISRLYLHSFANLIASPLFVFFISNAIIATLLANSRRVTGQNSDGRNVEMELFLELTKKNADHAELPLEVHAEQSRVAEQMHCQDKQIVSDNTTARTLENQVEFDAHTDTDSSAEIESDYPKAYRRSQSENLTGASAKQATRNLRRSETEKCRETARSCGNPWENLYSHDKMSNEQFQRTIEAFIAKQVRFLGDQNGKGTGKNFPEERVASVNMFRPSSSQKYEHHPSPDNHLLRSRSKKLPEIFSELLVVCPRRLFRT